MIEADERNIGVLSCGEEIAAALLFNRQDWLHSPFQLAVGAIDRLGTS